jgi:Zn finger protein HypA/HybF involved in hydrogenase expression
MHETIVAKQIIEEAKRHGEVESITIEVGDIAHLPAKEMEKTMKGLVDWEVKIEQKKAIIQCECGFKGEPIILEKGHDSTIWKCPVCDRVMPHVIEGNDIILKDVTVK